MTATASNGNIFPWQAAIANARHFRMSPSSPSIVVANHSMTFLGALSPTALTTSKMRRQVNAGSRSCTFGFIATYLLRGCCHLDGQGDRLALRPEPFPRDV